MKKIFLQLTLLFLSVTPAIAADDMGSLDLGPKNTSTFAPLTDITIPNLLTAAISLVLIVVFVTFFFILVLGGFKWITSSGDDKKLTTAKAQITHALTGLFIVLSVWALLNLIQTLFGINILTKGISIPTFSPSATPTPYEQVQHHFFSDPVGE